MKKVEFLQYIGLLLFGMGVGFYAHFLGLSVIGVFIGMLFMGSGSMLIVTTKEEE